MAAPNALASRENERLIEHADEAARQRRAVEARVAVAKAHAWRRDPGSFAHHLSRVHAPPTPGGEPYDLHPHSRFLASKFRQAVTTPGSRQIWCIPPRYGKSLMGSTWGPAWMLDLWPAMRVMCVSYNKELAALFGRDVRNIIAGYEGDIRVTLRQDSTAAYRWNTPQGGGMLCTGIDGTATGFGANLLVIDDPFKNFEEAQSELARDEVYNAWHANFKTRLQSGASVIIIMTRWHEDDLVGRLLEDDRLAIADGREPEGWELIRLPLIAERPDEYMHPVTGDPYEDPLGRQPGEHLSPKLGDGTPKDKTGLFTEAEVLKTRATTLAQVWNGMYQQRPAAAEGGIFKRGWWKWYKARPPLQHFDMFLTSWDMTFKDSDGTDYVVGQVWGRIGADKYLLDQVRARMDFTVAARAVQTLANKHPYVRLHLIEDKANGPAIIARLRKIVPGLVAVPVAGSKTARAMAAAPEAESGNVYLPEGAEFAHDFVEELAAFPKGAHDDQVDTFSQAIDRFAKTPTIEDDEDDGEHYEDMRQEGRR